MFQEIVQRLRGASRQKAPAHVPEGTRLYAVGDIHGRFDLLQDLLLQIVSDGVKARGVRKILVFLGDYVDRGLQSREVIELLVRFSAPGFEPVFLKGNHEEAMCQFMGDAQFGKTWKYYGGLETLHSYGITELTLSDDPADFERARDHLLSVMPKSHLNFLNSLALSFELGDYFFAHAGIRPGIGLHRQVEQDLLWIRDEFLESRASHGKVIVHGHTPHEQVEFRSNRVGVDTGAYMTGVLTALVLEGAEQRLLQTGLSQPDLKAAG